MATPPDATTVVDSSPGVRPQWPLPLLITLSVGVCLSVTTELLPTGVLPALSRELGVTEGTLGILVTAYALMVAVFAAPLAVATARFPRRSLLIATLLGYNVSNLVMVVATVYPVALAARLAGGVMHGLFWGMLGGYVARLVAPERVGRALTITSAGGVGATLIAVPAGTAVSTVIGWRGAFGLLTALGLIVSAIAWRMLPNLPGRAATERVRMLAVLRTPGLVGLVATTTTVILGHFSFYTYIAPFLLSAGVPEERIGLALLVYGAMGVVGLLTAGIVIDRHLRASMVTAAVALCACFLVLSFGAHSTVLAVVFIAGTGVVLGSLPIFMQAAVLRIAPRHAETASALNASAFNIGIGGGALLGGVVVDGFGPGMLPILAAGLAAVGVLAIVLDRRVGTFAQT